MTTVVDAPARADGLQLCGTTVGSGYRTPPSLVRRGDGQTLQLTRLLYLVLEAVDGRRTHAEIASVVSVAMQREVPEHVVASLIDDHLRPLGLLRLDDGSHPEVRRSDPLLGLKLKLRITDPRTTRRITDPFRVLFRPVLVIPVVIGFLAVLWWVFFQRGLAPAAYDAFHRPQLLLLVFAVTVLSGGFHEFGHAAAARFSGAQPGVMGAGIYLVWPAFYTDVTDSYRLDRRGRLRTDLGGLYFNALVVVLTFAWWYYTQWEALLLLVATQSLQMMQQLLPLLRFDGYHVLADIAGVPDLYHRIRPTLLGLLPHRWSSPENRILKPWSRAVITTWVLVTIPMMALMLLAVVGAVPRLLGTAWDVVHEDAVGVTAAWRAGGMVDAGARVLDVLTVVLSLLACVLILGRVGVRWSRGLAVWSRGSLMRRGCAAALAATVVTTLMWAWWPHPGTYRPIGPDEQGLLSTMLVSNRDVGVVPRAAVPAGDTVGAAARARLDSGQPLQATFQEGAPLPTEDEPQLAIVLVPTEGGCGRCTSATSSSADVESQPAPAGGTEDSDDGPASGEPWVFPFNQPLPPEPGDNQALAVNTTDGSVTYDLAFALVWATGDEVLNVNEAHAYAACSDCVTVAVAFQVVLVVGDAQVIAPQNLSAAANYECYECITAAIAQQLVLSVGSQPDTDQLTALAEVWAQLEDLAASIQQYTLQEVMDILDDVAAQIIDVLGVTAYQPGGDVVSTPAEASPSSSEGPTEGSTDAPTQAPSPTPSQTPTQSPTGAPTQSPSPVPSPASPSPSATSTSPVSPSSSPAAPSPSATPDSPTDSQQAQPSSSPSTTP